MQQNPIQVKDDHQQNWTFVRQFRDPYQHDKNISEEHFKHKDQIDWESIFSPLERIQRKSNQQFNRKFLARSGLSKSLLNRNCTSQEPFVDIKVESYRDRHQQNQIHPNPMNFQVATSNPKSRPLLYSKHIAPHEPYSQVDSSSDIIKCKRAFHHQAGIVRNLEESIEDKKTIILSKTMRYKPKTRVQTSRMSSTVSSFHTASTAQNTRKSVVIDPVVAEEFRLGKKRSSKIYFKDVESIANTPEHNLIQPAKQVLFSCNYYQYKKNDN